LAPRRSRTSVRAWQCVCVTRTGCVYRHVRAVCVTRIVESDSLYEQHAVCARLCGKYACKWRVKGLQGGRGRRRLGWVEGGEGGWGMPAYPSMLLCPIITKTLTGVSPAAHLGGVMGGTTGCHGPGGGDGGALTETRLGMAAATPIERARLSIVYAIWTVCVCVCVCVCGARLGELSVPRGLGPNKLPSLKKSV
jgi:hypothetical protein